MTVIQMSLVRFSSNSIMHILKNIPFCFFFLLGLITSFLIGFLSCYFCFFFYFICPCFAFFIPLSLFLILSYLFFFTKFIQPILFSFFSFLLYLKFF